MKVIAIDQGTDSWHELRSKHIGASEVPAIMGTSDFGNAYEVWAVKTGKKPPFKGNWATQRGTEAEPKIKKLYEELHNTPLLQPVVEFEEWPILMASLDGYNEEIGLVVEFKYPSAEKHYLAKNNQVPATYVDQIQAQLMVTGCNTAHYVSYDGFEIEVVVVREDKVRQKEILERLKAFWSLVETDTPPEGAPKILVSENLEVLASRYKTLSQILEYSKEELEMIRERICELVKDKKAEFYGLSLTRSERIGNVDYKAIPELNGVDLNKYRKPSSEVVTIKELK